VILIEDDNVNYKEKDYQLLDDAIVAAEEMAEVLETVVYVTKEADGKFKLFGNGEVVIKIV
jgi:hypothetical protein